MSTLAITTVLGPAVSEYVPSGEYQPASTYFYSIYGGERSVDQADVSERLGNSEVLITRFTAGVNSRPTSGSWTFSLMRDSTPLFTCTVSGTQRSCVSTGYVQVSPADRLSIRCAEGGAPYPEFSAAAFQITYMSQ